MLLECRSVYSLASCYLFFFCCMVSWMTIRFQVEQSVKIVYTSTLVSLLCSIIIAVATVLYRLFKGSHHHKNVKYTPLPPNLEMGGSGTVSSKPASLDILPLLFAVSKLGLIMFFFYVCDRYHILLLTAFPSS